MDSKINSLDTKIGEQMKTPTEQMDSKITSLDKKFNSELECVKELMTNEIKKQKEYLYDSVNNQLTEKFRSMEGIINESIEEKAEKIREEVETKVDREVRLVSNKQEEIRTELNHSVNTLKGQIVKVQDETEMKLQETAIKVNADVQNKAQTLESNVNQKLVEIKEQVKSLETVKSLAATFTLGGVYPNHASLEIEKFDPKGNVHPVIFMDACRKIIPSALPEEERIRTARTRVSGDASSWVVNATDNCMTLEEFLAKFEEKYWSVEKQDEVLQEFMHAPPYRPGKDTNMKTYCENLCRKIEHVKGQMSERSTMTVLREKLPWSVRGYLMSEKDKASFLRKVGDMDVWYRSNDNRYHGNNTSNQNRNNYANPKYDNNQVNEFEVRCAEVDRGRGRGRSRGRGAHRGRGCHHSYPSDDRFPKNEEPQQ